MGLELRKEHDVSPCRFVKQTIVNAKSKLAKNLAKVEGKEKL